MGLVWEGLAHARPIVVTNECISTRPMRVVADNKRAIRTYSLAAPCVEFFM
jgi:hypothetical protein